MIFCIKRINVLCLMVFLLFCDHTEAGNQLRWEKSASAHSNHQVLGLTGRWVWESNNGESQFTLELKEKGDSIIGLYCAVAYSGNRMDCPLENESNIYGYRKGDSVFVAFNSFYGAEGGKACLTILSEKVIKWEITKWPIGGDCFAPPSVKLERNNLK